MEATSDAEDPVGDATPSAAAEPFVLRPRQASGTGIASLPVRELQRIINDDSDPRQDEVREYVRTATQPLAETIRDLARVNEEAAARIRDSVTGSGARSFTPPQLPPSPAYPDITELIDDGTERHERELERDRNIQVTASSLQQVAELLEAETRRNDAREKVADRRDRVTRGLEIAILVLTVLALVVAMVFGVLSL